MPEVLVLSGPQNTRIELAVGDLVVFIDETGDEFLTDPRHPVFGLAGCACKVEDYESGIQRPWRELKSSIFGDPGVALHATEIDVTNKEFVAALSEYFETNGFGRLAAVVTLATENLTSFERYKLDF